MARYWNNILPLILVLLGVCLSVTTCRDGKSLPGGCQLFTGLHDIIRSISKHHIPPPLDVIRSNADLWMTRLPAIVKNRPLRSISIPGTHDSFAIFDEMYLENNFIPDEYNKEEQFVMNLFRKEVKDWSVAQNMSATQQLIAGIRYFDFRIAYGYANKTAPLDYYAGHGLLAGPVLQKLIEINTFLETRPGEVVILDFQAIFNVSLPTYTILGNLIHAIFGSKIFPCSNLNPLNVSLQQLVSLNKRVLVLFKHPSSAAVFRDFCNRTILSNPWADTTELSTLLPFLTQHFNSRNKTMFYIVQGMLTPRLESVVSCIFSHCVTLETYAKSTNPALVDWLKTKSDVNIVITDYSQIGNITPGIILKNYD
ncbi:PI-PLC X domain-containing protein 3-like isoform X2 [Tubulanus polymorphus]|uniref:PI-PLC X domain-containing protein 3-like isoform X2 n=1 Tax=Tubulanus polymorphus TaxID=672921 RepID=UPI003DA6BB21